MFVTSDDVGNIAFITMLEAGTIKDSIIMNAELTYIKPALTSPLYTAITDNPGGYPVLMETYLKPCLCYYVKYLVYNSLFVERFNQGKALIDPTYSITNNTEIRQETVQDTLKIAQNFEKAMVDFVIEQGYAEYTPPVELPAPDTGRLKCGFYI
jgi:hypothetical protein